MQSFKDFLLTEAKVAPKNVDRTADTVVRYFNSKLKRNYKLVDAYDAIKGSEKIRQGLYKDESGSAIGVNFKTSGEFYSISVWDKLLLDKTGRYNQPKREIKFESSESFAKVLPNAIDELFGTGGMPETTVTKTTTTRTPSGTKTTTTTTTTKATTTTTTTKATSSVPSLPNGYSKVSQGWGVTYNGATVYVCQLTDHSVSGSEYLGYEGGLRAIEDIYDRVLATYR